MESVRAQLRAKEEAQRGLDEQQARIAREELALNIEREIQRQALEPAEGWWRPAARGGMYEGPKLNGESLMQAYAVGCTTAEIAQAANTTTRKVLDAKQNCRARKGRPLGNVRRCNWKETLTLAKHAGIYPAELARRLDVTPSCVWQAEQNHRVLLPRKYARS